MRETITMTTVEQGRALSNVIVPTELSRRVFDAAPEPKRYVPILASHHNDPVLFAGEEMLAAVSSFLDEWLVDSAWWRDGLVVMFGRSRRLKRDSSTYEGPRHACTDASVNRHTTRRRSSRRLRGGLRNARAVATDVVRRGGAPGVRRLGAALAQRNCVADTKPVARAHAVSDPARATDDRLDCSGRLRRLDPGPGNDRR
ncbi:MAG TPA: hypothetical protein VGQ02_07510 [Candidatus Limnocylindrales bacterium]|jgi:hypothetical protein|nr:hypothetical protein [Candidatus Limnocylindrales bacterium]